MVEFYGSSLGPTFLDVHVDHDRALGVPDRLAYGRGHVAFDPGLCSLGVLRGHGEDDLVVDGAP